MSVNSKETDFVKPTKLDKEAIELLNDHIRDKTHLIKGWDGNDSFTEEELLSWMEGIPPRGLTFVDHEPGTHVSEVINHLLDFVAGLHGDPVEKLKGARYCR